MTAPKESNGKREQKELERWAAKRVTDWRNPSKDDYSFRLWTGLIAGGKAAGCIYEYARESRKLRCLLALMSPNRPHEIWEIERPACIDGRRPEPGEIDSYPPEALWSPSSFEDLNERDAEHALGGFLYCLVDLADYLADNTSFGNLLRTKGDELKKTFGGFGLNELKRVKGRFGSFFPVPEPVEWGDAQTATDDWDQRIIEKGGSEDLVLRINSNFTDSEIREAMKRFACAHRGPTGKEQVKTQERQKTVASFSKKR
jgi:hypothetical protein